MATEADIKALEKIVEKLDDSIEKLTEVNNNIGKLLAVHEERMNNIEKDTDRNVEDIRELHTKINEFSKEMLKRMDALDHSFDTKMKSQAETATKQHNEIQANVERKIDLLGDRLRVLEQWKYFVIGAAAVIGYLVKYLMG
jgi:molecular chaperone GrpE (heat shock protein)